MEKMIYALNRRETRSARLLGGKGASLVRMIGLNMRVPHAFTITTKQCMEFYRRGKQWPPGLKEEIDRNVRIVEKETGRSFGSDGTTIQFSGRSGGFRSAPGMMDTALNLGMNDKTVITLANETGNERFAYDCYRRGMMMFATLVFGLSDEPFEELLTHEKAFENVKNDNELSASALKRIVEGYKVIISEAGKEFPQDPYEQLYAVVAAVFLSWNNKRAIIYRNENNIPHRDGTAVTIQMMRFGNMNDNSGTGVVFTSNPATGEKGLYIDWLQNAQGEDVVAGIRTPQPGSKSPTSNGLSLEEVMPEVYAELVNNCNKLVAHFKDMVDIEFTIENGVLYMLQARVGKRTGAAAVRLAVEQSTEGLITKEKAIERITEENISQMLHSNLKPGNAVPFLEGLNASPGAGIGRVVFTAEAAVEWRLRGENVLLVRPHTSPDDIQGMLVAEGIITEFGGRTSHAAVVGRQMGTPSIVGCTGIKVNVEEKFFTVGEKTFYEGDLLSLDGGTGLIYEGEIEQVLPEMTPQFQLFLNMCKQFSPMEVWTNAEVPDHARTAIKFGAMGIGLARTEHMSFGDERLAIMQNILLYMNDPVERMHFISLLEPYFFEDFKELFEVFTGLPVTIRLLDPPLHEFIPDDKRLEELDFTGEILEKIKEKRNSLHESNPMMGNRGDRLNFTYPDLYEMPVRALMNAACVIEGTHPDVMVPFVIEPEEFIAVRAMVDRIAREVMKEHGVTIPYRVGVMIETPSAALLAGEIAKHANFFSFGTNDLTQLVKASSRDDSGAYISIYTKKGLMLHDPFVSIDERAVGRLMKMAISDARAVNPKLKIGICGEHGGDPQSIKFFNDIGLDYVSCSPLRVPIAIHAVAKASVEKQKAARRKKARENKAVKKQPVEQEVFEELVA